VQYIGWTPFALDDAAEPACVLEGDAVAVSVADRLDLDADPTRI
jgi:hypothetical protein